MLGDILRNMQQDPRYKAKLLQKKIENGWLEIMGKWISRETRSIRVADGRLTLKIASAPLREELTFMKDQIRDKINTLLGEDYITEVIVR